MQGLSMDFYTTFLPLLTSLLPALAVIAVASLLIKLFSRRPSVPDSDHRFREQVLIVVTVLVAIVGVIIALPVGASLRGQLLTLLGLLLTAIITLSSPTIAANAMAGFMLRSLRSFSPGDFIQVGEYLGRVTEQDLFHIEIQTEDRDLLTIPNSYIAANPVKVVHADGTVISAEVSLGYDVDNQIVEEVLLAAANAAGLEDSFVYVIELGDFSVVYRVSGFLGNVKKLLSKRSELRRHMIDQLHSRQIEIVSPGFMNQRPTNGVMIPQRRSVAAEGASDEPENMVFDKAERAQQIKELKENYAELKLELADGDDNEDIVKRKQRRLKAIKRAIGMLEK